MSRSAEAREASSAGESKGVGRAQRADVIRVSMLCASARAELSI